MVRFSFTSTILACLLVSSIDAFSPAVVVGSKSSFVPSNSNMVALPRDSGSTALNMNLFDRFSRVAKSNLNNILKNLEDPEKIMNQALEDMQVCIIIISFLKKVPFLKIFSCCQVQFSCCHNLCTIFSINVRNSVLPIY